VDADALLSANFKIIHSIIGLGKTSSLALLSAVRFDQFSKPRSVGCFAGLTPRKYESGTSISKHECISRRGSSQLRKRLYFPAMVAMQHNPQMRAFAERLRAKGKPSKVIICAVMRKLLVLVATLIRKQVFYDSTMGMLPA
jgi:transposase